MTHTLFYVTGGALVVLALLAAFVGMKSERFPSTGVMRAGIAVMAALVAVTLYGAVILAADEKKEREHNAAAAAEVDEAASQGDTPTTGAEGGAGGESQGEASASTGQGEQGGQGEKSGGAAKGDPKEGAKVFVSAGCGGCHTMKSLGSDAAGTVGPDLDTALAGKDAEFIHTSIVDPEAEITEGYPGGTMPATYEQQLSAEQIDSLVAFLSQQAGG